MPRRAWATAVLLAAAGLAPPAAAQPLPPADLPAPARPAPPAAILGTPVAVRGEPVRPTADPIPTSANTADAGAVPVSFTEPPAVSRPTRAAGLRAPVATGREPSTSSAVPAGTVDAPAPRTTSHGPPADPVNDLLIRRSGDRHPREPGRDDRDGPGRRPTWKLGDNLDGLADRVQGALGQRGEWFKGDHAFDGFASPVTNPFLFEDPRSVTEARLIYLYQKIPGGQPDFQGGNAQFFGVQARVAVTDRLSFVVNKLGGVRLDPGSGSAFEESTGFAELWLGPKYTFIRNEDAGRLLAGGLQFQIPVGSGSVSQNTGNLSLVPWATIGQNFFKDSFRFGSVNTLASGGYALSTNSARSDYLFLSGHIDLDVMNRHRFYPLAELNYVLVTTNGNAQPLMGSEGRDLFNFGSHAKGNGLLTGALGARFKITEQAQLGGAFEIPLAGPRDLFDYRFTVDFILRY